MDDSPVIVGTPSRCKLLYRRNASLRLKLEITMITPSHCSGLKVSPTSSTAKKIIMTGSDVLRSEARAGLCCTNHSEVEFPLSPNGFIPRAA